MVASKFCTVKPDSHVTPAQRYIRIPTEYDTIPVGLFGMTTLKALAMRIDIYIFIIMYIFIYMYIKVLMMKLVMYRLIVCIVCIILIEHAGSF